MDKLIKKIILGVLFCISTFGISFATPPIVDSKGKLQPVITEIDSAVIGNTKQIGDFSEFGSGLTFAKFFIPGADINANYAKGSPIGNFTVSRSASAPATYIDNNGTIRLITTSNTMRSDNRGYYNDTGFHLQSGMTLEGAGTNLLNQTSGASYNITTGLYTSWTKSYGTSTVQDCAVNPNKSQKVTYTYLGNEGDYSSVLVIPTNSNFTSPNNLTFSVYMRGNISGITTGTGSTQFLHFRELNATGSYVSESSIKLNNGYLSNLSDTVWKRFSFLINTTNTNTTNLQVQFIKLTTTNKPTAGENFTLEVADPQLELSYYPSSYIPTNGSVTSRPAESLSFSAANNFPAPYGNDVLSFDGAAASGDDNVTIVNSATGNQISGSSAYSAENWVFLRSIGEGSSGASIGKGTSTLSTSNGYSFAVGSSNKPRIIIRGDGATGTTASTQSIPLNTWVHISFTWSSGEAPKIYINGAEASGYDSSVILTTPGDDSTNSLVIGNLLSSDRTFDGFIKTVRIYRNKALNATEISTLYNAGKEASVASTGITGCTAEYLFKEGSGTVLTDTIAGNNGTINGATWSKDKHDFTILLAYAPTMLPNEQDASNKRMFIWGSSANNTILLSYNDNGSNRVFLGDYSNSNSLPALASPNYCSTWNRYQPHILVGTGSTITDANGKKTVLYDNGSLIASNTAYAIPVFDTLPTTFSIQSSSSQSMILGACLIWNRRLDASEVLVATNLVKEYLKWN